MRQKNTEKLIKLLEDKKITLKQLETLLDTKNADLRRPKISFPKTKNVFKIGIVSDTHLADKHCAIAQLHDFYKKCKEAGVQHVVHGGDLLTGMNCYPGQINDLVCFGVDNHIKYAVENYPNESGITTYFISGNHEETYTKLAGVDVGVAISEKRKDMIFLGRYNASIRLNGVYVMLQHMSGGSSYAVSYKIQRYVEKIPAGQKPQIYVAGHLHTSLFFMYRNVCTFLPG